MATSNTQSPPLRWARVLAILFAAFLVAEAAAQIFFLARFGRPYGSVFPYLWSPYGLVRNNPALTTNFTISPDGFREVRSYQRKKPPNTFRVLLMGGSVLYSGLGGPAVLMEEGAVPSDSTISQYLTKRLQADPAFSGVNVEVINAGVNFNRIVEISSAYLADYIKWSPDAVIVYGSYNNFASALRAGDFAAERTQIQSEHPWHLDFDRLVNERSLSSAVEAAFRQAVDASASMALLEKVAERFASRAAGLPQVGDLNPVQPDAHTTSPLAPLTDEENYFRLYSSYAAAIIAAARQEHQPVAFVWEYMLGEIGGIKPLSPAEQRLYPYVKEPDEERDYNFRMRDRWKAFLAEQGVSVVDPLDELRHHAGTVYIDYLHYTKSGNEFIAGVTYQQLHDMLVRALADSRQGSGRAATAG